MRWVPREGVTPAPVPAAPAAPPGARLAVAGAVVAFVGAVAIVVASAIPYATYTDPASPGTPSIFFPGYPGALWYAAEPVLVAVAGIAAGVLLIALRGRVVRALAAGVLLALGVQTFALFIGYVGAAATGPGEHAAIGGGIGLLGGLAVAIGGALAAASLSVKGKL